MCLVLLNIPKSFCKKGEPFKTLCAKNNENENPKTFQKGNCKMDFGEIKRLNIFQPILCKKGEPGIQSSPKYSITHLSKTFDETFCIKSCANNGRYVLYNSLMNCETPKYFASFFEKIGEPGLQSSPKYSITHLSKTFG